MIKSFLAAALSAAALNAGAAEFSVAVGGGVGFNRFVPQDIQIEVGDTVTWFNQGGFHNVNSDDGLFRCANGCDGDGMGGDGSASTDAWEFSLVFNTADVFGYHCVPHEALGMVGSVTVMLPETVHSDGFEN